MWFWFSVIALLCWSGSDLFSKIGCRDASDKFGFLKMVTAVGVVMGIHAFVEIFIQGVHIDFSVILTYLPVSMLYISSMTIGYLGLRYIELSISSPICNSSGALVAVICICFSGITGYTWLQLLAVMLVCIGVVLLGVVEAREDDELRAKRQERGNYKYAKSFLALALPVIYCLLDALGTYADTIVLEKLDESSANVAYELTFLFCGVLCAVYLIFVRHSTFKVCREVPKYVGAAFETAGQFAYIYAIADSKHVAFSAPIISAYCAVSVLWSRIFLKEKLSVKHYVCIVLTVIGIVILGYFDE